MTTQTPSLPPTLTPERRALVNHSVYQLIQKKLDGLHDTGIDTSARQERLNQADFIRDLPESSPFCVYGLISTKVIVLNTTLSIHAIVRGNLLNHNFIEEHDLFRNEAGWCVVLK